MRICLVVSEDFPMDRRAYRTARTLVDAGHLVVVVCRGPMGAPDDDRVDGIDVKRIEPETAFSGATGVLGGLRYVATLVHPAWRNALEDLDESAERAADSEDRPADGDADVMEHDTHTGLDAIHVHDLPLVKTALAVGEERGIPVVADLRENHPEAVRQRRGRWRARDHLREPRAIAQRGFMVPWRLGRLETGCVERVDHVIANCEEARAHYLRECEADPREVSVIRDTLAEIPVPDEVPALETATVAARAGRSESVPGTDSPGADPETLPFEFETETTAGTPTPDAEPMTPETGAVGAETLAPESGVGTEPGDPDPAATTSGTAPAVVEAPFDHEDAFVVTAREEFARDGGLDTLVEAAALAAEESVELRLVVLGTPRAEDAGEAYRHDLEALTRRRLIGGRTLLTEVGNPTHAAAHVAASDAFVLPKESNPHTETTVSPMLYAALAGTTPVVATDVAPQRRIVERTDAGLVVPTGDPAAMAAALTEVQTPGRADAFGANARAAIEGAFDPERDDTRLRELYATLRAPTPVIELE